MIDIRQPNITAQTDQEQLRQMRSYLYQLAQQLNWAFGNISAGGTSIEVQQVEDQAGQRMDPKNTFAAIKNLIIKSADIVDSYYEKISSKLDGIYVAQSDFGVYVEQTKSLIEANSTGIKQNYNNQQTLISNQQTIAGKVESMQGNLSTTDKKAGDALEKAGSAAEDAASAKDAAQKTAAGFGALEAQAKDLQDQLGALNATVISTNAYIKTGLLYEGEDGIPVYGLEIGQTNKVNGQDVFSKFARFSANRLSFYDQNSTEVAWISDYVLHITNAEITGNLYVLNRFRIFYGNGLAFQWIGG